MYGEDELERKTLELYEKSTVKGISKKEKYEREEDYIPEQEFDR